MSHAKEIKNKIKSICSTQKITSAMEMVAASKMKKATHRMESSRPYAAKIRSVIQHLLSGHLEYQHPYLLAREVKRVGFMVVSTDRGLCGGLNTLLFRQTLSEMERWDKKGIAVACCPVGKKAEGFFKSVKSQLLASVSELGDTPTISTIIGAVKVMLDAFDAGEIDRIYLSYNEYVNTMLQKPKVELLLPLQATQEKPDTLSWDYLYEPSAPELIDTLLTRYVESIVYQGLVENNACEQSARMVAMKNATENAGGFIDELSLKYNKARQAGITQEISEIVAGANAV